MFLLALLSAISLSAHSQSGVSILIRNATLINKAEEQDVVVVNILIKDSKLDIITQDLIPLDQANESYDASGEVENS